MNDRELAAMLDADGRHLPRGIEQRGDNGNYRGHCSCGYVSTRRRTPQLAAEALIVHMRRVGAEMVSKVNGTPGVSLPRVRIPVR
jgi:hypothetical protein